MKSILELVTLSSALVAALAMPRAAHAQQNQGFSIDRFEPADRGSDWFAADSLDLRGRGRLLLGATADWAEKPLVLYAPNGDPQDAIIEHQLFVHLGADVVIGDRLRFGLNVPVALSQAGTGATLNGVDYASNDETALGDMRFSADLRIAGVYRGLVELAIGVAAYLPTGSKDAFTGDGQLRIAPRSMVAGQLGLFVYAARVGLSYRSNNSGFAGAATGSELFATGAAGVRILDERLVIGPELYGSTNVTHGDAFFARRSTPFEALFGAHYLLSSLRLGAGVGPGLTRGIGAPAWRALLSLEWASAIEGVRGDRDHDGIFDDSDACRDVPGAATADAASNGCPPEKDRDHDGILDPADACPDEPGRAMDDPQTNGCPAPKDRDQDGIEDAADACRDEAGIATDDPKTNGCPPPRDRDKDGALDDQDACPDAPGPVSADLKKNGCPEARIEHGQIMIRERVEFENNRANIQPVSETVLNAVLDVLKAHPEFTKLGVQGYTDNRGKPVHNKRLSQLRANSVVAWLVNHGIARTRLSARGLGAERPIDSNDADEGRQNNRRVEFRIQGGDPSNATPPRRGPEP